MSRPTHLTSAAAIALVLVSATALANKSVTVGQTYPIAEPDLLTEIKQRAASVDWHKWMRVSPASSAALRSVPLPRAEKTASHLFDPTYYLPDDIRDADGKLIAPKGLPINVYKRIKVPGRYIVVGDSPEDLAWLKNVAKPRQGDKVLLAGGNVLLARENHQGIPFLLLDERFVERFGLRAVPSIVQQEGTELRVSEYLIDGKGNVKGDQ